MREYRAAPGGRNTAWGKKVLLGILLIGLLPEWAMAMPESEGIALERTRVIYPASAKNGITFTVTNRTSTVYLLQSRVLPWAAVSSTSDRAEDAPAESVAPPFIVLPPLLRFPPEEAITLRIRLTKNALPQDRESLFSLSLKAIPSQAKPGADADVSGASMVLALQNNLKLFYRPEGLAVMSAEARAAALQFAPQGAHLTATNPTPYYVTFGTLDIGTTAVPFGDQRMLAPYSSATYDVSVKSGATVSWQVMDDEGGRTPPLRRELL